MYLLKIHFTNDLHGENDVYHIIYGITLFYTNVLLINQFKVFFF